ncbi:hypothetical protein GIL16c_gp15 [Bacillus phage GIL16c]|uniref:Uncharacterized protein n=2 Tax=root TaxID=1 RepID=Q5ILB7_9VIRU|nr:hypothetical protein GIL16c_gp15 [Bacillus phage GIL16c]AAW33578.1 hypothetical protein [Bacillus phage GIL16c]
MKLSKPYRRCDMHLLEVIVPTAMSSFALGIIVGANIMNCNGFKKK